MGKSCICRMIADEKVFADDNEKELIYEMDINPMFQNAFLNSADFFNAGV
jgi:hypothetical protein